MTQWVSQTDAVALLANLGDKISQQALSQYLKGHPEVVREVQGRSMRIDWASLKQSRVTRTSRGPASQGPLFEDDQTASVVAVPPPARRDPEAIDLSARRARADTDRAESEARRSRILAAEAEGRVMSVDEARTAFVSAGVALERAMQDNRQRAVEDVRAAVETRDALAAMKDYERRVRTAFANAVTELAQTGADLAAAE